MPVPSPAGTADLRSFGPHHAAATRCACRTLREIDAHLVGLRIWRDHQLRSVAIAPPGRRELCRARIAKVYADDCDMLLDRRTRLAA